MAATRLIPLHINKGKTVAQCLADRTDYSQNAAKTNDGKFISSYECDPQTADEEFLLSKRQYQHITGKQNQGDIIAYQIRQSFKPSEVTPEEANQIGYELAMRFTKGNHAFIVATHIDRAHIHNHIIYNSTALDCTRKFKNFYLSSFAIQRISDRLCLEHGLSIIQPKPYRERKKHSSYPKRATFRDELCQAIDVALASKPKDFADLCRMLSEAGFEVKQGKCHAVRGKGQKRFIRFRSLGEGYTEEDLKLILAGKKVKHKSKQQHTRPFGCMLIDIQAKLNQGKGTSYERWAKVFNLKQMAQVMCYLQENNLDSVEALQEKTAAATTKFNDLSDSIKTSEKRLAEIAVLKTHIINYSKTRETYTQYRKAGYNRIFLEAHREEITLHKAAKDAFNALDLKKIPRVKELNAEYAEVLSAKKKSYSEYRDARKEMQECQIALKTVETLLDIEQKQEKEREQEQKKAQEQNR